MKKQKMKWSFFLVAVMCACTLAGCGSTADSVEFIPEEDYKDYENYEDSEESMDDIDSFDETEGYESDFIAEEKSDKAANEAPGNTCSESGIVLADYLEDVVDRYPDYIDASEQMNGSRTDYETVILFHTDRDVEDFRVFSLEMNIDDNGIPDFTATEVFRTGELKKDTPIAVPLSFPGDMSHNGFCFKGPDGNLETFTISQSGMDGSLVINPESFAVP